MRFINYPFLFFRFFFFKMATNFLDLATTLENLGARWLLEKKVNFVPWVIETENRRPNNIQITKLKSKFYFFLG